MSTRTKRKRRKKNVKPELLLLGILLILFGWITYKKNRKPEVVKTKEKIILENEKGNLTLMDDGKYQTKVEGYGGPMTVELLVEDGYMKKIKIKDHHEELGYAGLAIDRIPKEMIRRQTADVDIITGATMTSRAIQEGVKTCIRQAGGE